LKTIVVIIAVAVVAAVDVVKKDATILFCMNHFSQTKYFGKVQKLKLN